MRNIDISVAVATDSGLITPIVTDVPNKTLPEISADIKALAAKAREGKLQLHEVQVRSLIMNDCKLLFFKVNRAIDKLFSWHCVCISYVYELSFDVTTNECIVQYVACTGERKKVCKFC